MKPLLGRTFLPGEEQDGRNSVAVLSYEVWQQNFGGNPSVIGQSVHIDGFPYTIVGVMPAGFRFPLSLPNLVYTPMRIPKELRTARGDHWLQVIGRLKPGCTRGAGAGRHESCAGQYRAGSSGYRQRPHARG